MAENNELSNELGRLMRRRETRQPINVHIRSTTHEQFEEVVREKKIGKGDLVDLALRTLFDLMKEEDGKSS